MKKVTLTITFAAAAILAGSTVGLAHADEDWHSDSQHYKDLVELKQLHIDFHQGMGQ